MKRHFTYQDERSDKFWSITVSGATVTVVFGKTGSAGRVSTETFETAEQAEKAAARLIAEKLRKGYVEQTAGEFSEDDFWNLIERARKGSEDAYETVEHLESLLAERPVDDIVAFERIRRRLFAQSYQPALWAAAYLLNDGCSDDGFEYFRGWLLTKGRAAFYQALENPDSLAAVLRGEDADGELECEDVLYVACNAFQVKSKQPFETFYDQVGDDPAFAYPPLTDEDLALIEADNEVTQKLLPRLFRKKMGA
jgi:predicted DNA-binding WGR domain protein